MKYRYYIGDPDIPWWVKELVNQKLIIEVRENAAITYFLTYRTGKSDSQVNYLYDGDFLELNEESGAVTIGYADWDTALSSFFEKSNWSKFVESLKKGAVDRMKKEQNEANFYKDYWA